MALVDTWRETNLSWPVHYLSHASDARGHLRMTSTLRGEVSPKADYTLLMGCSIVAVAENFVDFISEWTPTSPNASWARASHLCAALIGIVTSDWRCLSWFVGNAVRTTCSMYVACDQREGASSVQDIYYFNEWEQTWLQGSKWDSNLQLWIHNARHSRLRYNN